LFVRHPKIMPTIIKKEAKRWFKPRNIMLKHWLMLSSLQ
jgi:hypothetical protein